MVDFHTHVLPGMDDGSRSAEESVKMIEMLIEQGVDKIVLTPHFYAYMSLADEFIRKRDHKVERLLEAVKERNLKVDIYIGCEVLYFEELWRIDTLKEFCIQGTNYILIEMPFAPWSSTETEVIGNLISMGFIPVLAHFERYIKFRGNKGKIRTLLEQGAMLQMNCSYINDFFTRRQAINYIKKKYVFAIGSDCHRIDRRAPEYKRAADILKKGLGEEWSRFVSRQDRMLSSAKRIYP